MHRALILGRGAKRTSTASLFLDEFQPDSHRPRIIVRDRRGRDVARGGDSCHAEDVELAVRRAQRQAGRLERRNGRLRGQRSIRA
jgi:hypothetical protein